MHRIRPSISIGNFFDACTTEIVGLADFQRTAQSFTAALGKNRENPYRILTAGRDLLLFAGLDFALYY